MIFEIINTGNELMLGLVLNTHEQWLCRQFADRGYIVSRQVAVPDTAPDIEQSVREALSRADLIIVTGGLGPTSDDLTRDAIARLLGKSLKEDAAVRAHIEKFFTDRKRRAPESTRVQALVPEGALVLSNPNGTAPGLAMEVRPNPFRSGQAASWLVMLPGPPRELKPMFADFVMPLVERSFPLADRFVCRTLRTSGIGESVLQEKIERLMKPFLDAGGELGYCARPGQVDLRLTRRGVDAEKLVGEAEAVLRRLLRAHIFGTNDETLESVVVRLLTERKKTLALAESCTGGCIAHRLTNVPGASVVLRGGWVTYANEMKQKEVGVSEAALAEHGAVSEVVARQMAEGARRAGESDYAIAVTGIAGPGGGTPEKPVGTVFIALASPKKTEVFKMFNPWDRPTFKDVTTGQALNQLRLRLLAD
jgi:nicotinamide-nucleotide amidase